MDPRRLREETRPDHEAAEAAMSLMTPGLSLNAYRGVLHALFPVLQTWEVWSAQYAPDSLQPLLSERRRSRWIAQDLRVLGGKEAPPEDGEGSPIHWDRVVGIDRQPGYEGRFAAAFLGVMYIVEGSTLGGRLIARHIEPALGLANGQGAAYLRGHGEATGALWQEITATISAVPEIYADVLIASARRAFQVFRDAFGVIKPVSGGEPIPG